MIPPKSTIIWLNTVINHFTNHPMQFIGLLISVSFSKSTVFFSSILPPASIVLFISISIGSKILPQWEIWMAITIGSIAGSAVDFYIGKIFIYTSILNKIMIKYQIRFFHIYKKLNDNATLALFTSRFIAVLRYLVPLTAGMLHMNNRKFYYINISSAILWSLLYVCGTHYLYKYSIFCF